MIKLIAIDLDGTFLKQDHSVSFENIEAVNKIKDLGVKVIIATGRPYELVKPYLKYFSDDSLFILANGATIVDKEGNIIYEKKLDKDVYNKIVSVALKYNINFNIYGLKTLYYTDTKGFRKFIDHNRQFPKEEHANFVKIDNNIDEIYSNDTIFKVLMIERKFPEKYKAAFNELSSYNICNVVQSQVGYVDCNSLGVSKGEALKYYASSLDINLDECMAFGDQHNDLSMLEIVSESIAMGNAVEKVKEVCKHTTLSNDESGVSVFLNSYFKLK